MNVLVLSPHTDDGELGCGGMVAKHIVWGYNIKWVVFSDCRESNPGFELYKESGKARRCLSITDSELYNWPVRNFDMYRQEILDKMIEIRNNAPNRFDRVYVPNTFDIHQDHQVITSEAMRCFKYSDILGYELPWNNLKINNTYFCSLSDFQLKSKLRALKQYKSQKYKKYFEPEFIVGWAQLRGLQAGCKYAEAFEVIRIIE